MIKTKEEYEAGLERLYELMDAEYGTPEGEELDYLADEVNAYESWYIPI